MTDERECWTSLAAHHVTDATKATRSMRHTVGGNYVIRSTSGMSHIDGVVDLIVVQYIGLSSKYMFCRSLRCGGLL